MRINWDGGLRMVSEIKRINVNTIRVVVVAIIVTVLGCSGSPFGGDVITGGQRQIRGFVELSDGSNPEGAYVWLEQFDTGTRVAENGKFELILPPASASGVPGGVDGVFNVYYYLANYNLAISEVVVRNGEFAYSQGDIDKNGKLNNPKKLFKALRITTTLVPNVVYEDTGQLVDIRVSLVAAGNGTVRVFYPRLADGLYSPFLLKNLETDEVLVRETTIAGINVSDTLTISSTSSSNRLMVLPLGPGDLAPGKYEAIPYLMILNEAVPPELIRSLGENVEELGPGYLDMPFRRDGGMLEVKEKAPPSAIGITEHRFLMQTVLNN